MSIGGSELLVRLDTSPLENRLNGLTDQWEGQVRGLRGKVDDCTAGVLAVSADVAAIQRFLLSYHNREMVTALSATRRGSKSGSISAEETSGVAADPLEQCTTVSEEATATENLLKMVTLARRLLAENEALRTSLDNATAALASYNATNESLQHEVVRLRDLTTAQSERLQSMMDWLGMSGLSMSKSAADGGEKSLQTDDTQAPTADVLLQSTEAVLAHSPLLLSFRRFLLRDLTERLTSVVDQQSKDFHDSVAHLESRIQAGQCVVNSGDSQQDGGSNGDLLETVRTLTKRVKELDQRSIKREEFTSLMRSKADSLLLPVKADSAAVSEIERRLTLRCTDLEERCTYADAERAEFRAILRSLIAAQSGTSNASRPSGHTSPDLAASSSVVNGHSHQGVPERGAVLRDLLPALSGSPATASSLPGAQKSLSFQTPRGATSSPSSSSPLPQQQQLYRVVGNSLGLGVHGIPALQASSVGASTHETAAAHLSATSGTRKDGARPQSTSLKESEDAAIAIGMTASQCGYASYVSQQLNRKQVAALPTLPYERMANTQ